MRPGENGGGGWPATGRTARTPASRGRPMSPIRTQDRSWEGGVCPYGLARSNGSWRPGAAWAGPSPAGQRHAAGADRAARARVGDEAAIAHHEGAVDQDVPDAGRRAGAVRVGGLVGDRGGIEHHDVGVGAGLQAALARSAGTRSCSSRAGPPRLHLASASARPSGPSRVSSRSARPNVPAVRGWVIAVGGSGQARGSAGGAVQVSGIASLATTAPGKVSDRISSARSAGSSSWSRSMITRPPGSAWRSSRSRAALATRSPVGA